MASPAVFQSPNHHKLPIELLLMIMDDLPQDDWTDRTMSQICRTWRRAFHYLADYTWRVQTFPRSLPNGLDKDEYYINYWDTFKKERRRLKHFRIVWVIPDVPDYDRIRLTSLVAAFIDRFPTASWADLHIVSFPWDALDNTAFASLILPEKRLIFPALSKVTVTGRLDPDHTNVLIRAIDRVSTRQNLEFVPDYPVENGASLYPNLCGHMWPLGYRRRVLS